MSLNFTVLIPARLSSSRLPEKALADIGGKPMVVRVAEQAAQAAAGQIIVATDHERIEAACTAHGVRAIMTSDAHQMVQRVWQKQPLCWAWLMMKLWLMCKVMSH